MSGGVDSSVAACLLKEQGYDVVGSHMNLVHLDGVEHGCCGPAARADAAEVARIAGIPFEIVDLSGEFAATVIDDFIGEHEAGRTPNPCARCNGEIKFGAFLRRADELGIDLVATGHYVRSRAGRPRRVASAPGRRRRQGSELHAAHAGSAPAVALAVPDRCDAEGRDARARRAVRVARGVQARFAGAVLRPLAETPARSSVRRHRSSCTRARSSTPTGARSRPTTGRSRSRSGSAVGLGVATGERRYVVDVDAATNRVMVGPQELLVAARARRRPRLVGGRPRPGRRPVRGIASASGIEATTCPP